MLWSVFGGSLFFFAFVIGIVLFCFRLTWVGGGVTILFNRFFTFMIGGLTLTYVYILLWWAYGLFFTLDFFFLFNRGAIYFYPLLFIFALVTAISVIFCLSYNRTELVNFCLYTQLIFLAGFLLFSVTSILLFFFAYELLLIPSFFILYRFAKTRRCVEAAYLMFFWTQLGALCLLVAFLYFFFILGVSTFDFESAAALTPIETNFFFCCILFGFGVKFPIWPFYGWLPRAHVEASTNFSIFLSGVLVKFAFFGFFRCILALQVEITSLLVYPFLVIGLSDAAFKLFYQVDLKKLVAYATVVEMHWLVLCVLSGHALLFLAGFCMLISHALLSTNAFLLVDAFARRLKTRLLTELGGVNFLAPRLFLLALVNLLVFLGLPGSLFFIAEFLFFYALLDMAPGICFWFVFLLYFLVPTFFFRAWFNALFGVAFTRHGSVCVDIDLVEFILYGGILIAVFWLGVTWQQFLF